MQTLHVYHLLIHDCFFFRNLTRKSISSVAWIFNKCDDVPWILKIDDDVLLNPFALRTYLESELKRFMYPSCIYGVAGKRIKPWRKGKYVVTKVTKYLIFICI